MRQPRCVLTVHEVLSPSRIEHSSETEFLGFILLLPYLSPQAANECDGDPTQGATHCLQSQGSNTKCDRESVQQDTIFEGSPNGPASTHSIFPCYSFVLETRHEPTLTWRKTTYGCQPAQVACKKHTSVNRPTTGCSSCSSHRNTGPWVIGAEFPA